jgi:tetratricopeptide (TPR) repeat protein
MFNTTIHLATALSVSALVYKLLKISNHWTEEQKLSPDFRANLQTASFGAAAIWAFHPVAVYGVSYLIQRSIIMATLFTVLMLLSVVLAMEKRRPVWYVAALFFFILALASKEYAITALMLVPGLYIYVQRPSFRQIFVIAAISLCLLASAAAVLFLSYGSILGQVFDETSIAFATQLEQVQPGISDKLYGLSILNQASLFWRYGLMWFAPWPSFMAIDIRPAFPLQLLSFELFGALFYLLLIAICFWVLIRRQDIWKLIAFAILVPSLLFMTEFATVWIQDPFVLYRSYLWSIGIPILIAILLSYLSSKKILVFSAAACMAVGAMSFERIDSFYDARSVWSDASSKIDRHAGANAVGRWRPFLNQGNDVFERGDYLEAMRLFMAAADLGENGGFARMNLGVAMQQLGDHGRALTQFSLAEAQGLQTAEFYFVRGESYFEIRSLGEAVKSYTKALEKSNSPAVSLPSRARRAEALTAMNDYDAAIADYAVVVAAEPDSQEHVTGLVMALHGKKDFAQALDVLNKVISTRPNAGAYYARALTHFQMDNRKASQDDLSMATKAEPSNPVFQQLARQLQTPPSKTKP